MGRPNVLPDDRWLPCKLRLVRLRMVDYDYDEGGAYWGGPSTHGAMYRAIGDCGDVRAEVFVRATTRQEAKARVRERLPNARFY